MLGSIGLILAERFPFLWLTVPLALVPAWRRLRPALSRAAGVGQTATRYLRAQRDPESGSGDRHGDPRHVCGLAAQRIGP